MIRNNFPRGLHEETIHKLLDNLAMVPGAGNYFWACFTEIFRHNNLSDLKQFHRELYSVVRKCRCHANSGHKIYITIYYFVGVCVCVRVCVHVGVCGLCELPNV